jgi:hypothetical protein
MQSTLMYSADSQCSLSICAIRLDFKHQIADVEQRIVVRFLLLKRVPGKAVPTELVSPLGEGVYSLRRPSDGSVCLKMRSFM